MTNGWKCPGCNRCHAPSVTTCPFCAAYWPGTTTWPTVWPVCPKCGYCYAPGTFHTCHSYALGGTTPVKITWGSPIGHGG